MDLGILTLFSAAILSFFDISVDAANLRGPNVCTQIQSVIHIDRIPVGGIMTQKIRYTTRCGFGVAQCSKYRIVYTPAYRERTKLVYRVAKVCCPGFVPQAKSCVIAPPPTTPKAKVPTVSTNRAATAGKSAGNSVHHPRIIPGRTPLSPDPATGTSVGTGAGIGTGTGTQTATGTDPRADPRVGGNPVHGGGTEGTSTFGGRNNGQQGGGTRNSNPNGPGVRTGTGPWVGLGPRPGLPDRGTQRTNSNPNHPRYQGPNKPLHRDTDGHRNSNVPGVYPNIVDSPDTDPGYSPRNYDPVMAFVSSATAAIGVLTLASTILGIYLLHRRQQNPPEGGGGGEGSKTFTSFKLRSLGSTKSIESKVEMQTLTGVKSSSGKEKGKGTKSGRSRAECPYVDIEQMRNAGLAAPEGQDDTMLLVPTANTSENNSKGSLKKSRRNSGKKIRGSLPPEPPTYAVVRKQRKDGSEYKDTRMEVSSICGDSSSLTASLDRPFTERESAHIYAQINRKSKGISTWSRSSSLPSRPTTMVSSNPDLQTSSSLRGIETFTKTLGRKLDVRRSGHESSGYSSLQESKETLLYDTCSRKDRLAKGGVAPAALYRSLKEQGLCGRTEYDKLSRCVKGNNDNDDSIMRGYATLSMDTE